MSTDSLRAAALATVARFDAMPGVHPSHLDDLRSALARAPVTIPACVVARIVAALSSAGEYAERFAELSEEPPGGDCRRIVRECEKLAARLTKLTGAQVR